MSSPTEPLLTWSPEWKGRSDGIVAHVFFSTGPNFWLATFAFTIEGWIYYSAINAVTPQLILNIGFEDDAWNIAIRQLSFKIASVITSIAVTWWATRFKDMSAQPSHKCISKHTLIKLYRDPARGDLFHHAYRINLLRLYKTRLGHQSDHLHSIDWCRLRRATYTLGSMHPIHSAPRFPLHSYRTRLFC